jgi:hypothetical protein
MKKTLILSLILLPGCANMDLDGLSRVLNQAAENSRANQPQRVNTSFPAPPGMTYYLTSQSVNGTLRYCNYQSIIHTINSLNLCPMSINQ